MIADIYVLNSPGLSGGQFKFRYTPYPLRADDASYPRRNLHRPYNRITDYARIAHDREGKREYPPHDQVIESHKQGPLPSGEFINLDTFKVMMQAIKKEVVDASLGEKGRTLSLEELVECTEQVEIRLVAIYGKYEKPVGAQRVFRLERSPRGLIVLPTTSLTKQYRTHREQRTVLQWLTESP